MPRPCVPLLFRPALLRVALPLLLLFGLGGCAVYPAPVYSRPYYAPPPPPPVAVYPRPYYGWGYRPYGYWRRW